MNKMGRTRIAPVQGTGKSRLVHRQGNAEFHEPIGSAWPISERSAMRGEAITMRVAAVIAIAMEAACGRGAGALDGRPQREQSALLTSDGSVNDCSAGVLGATMVRITNRNGKSYCIDETEVTQAQYATFVAAQVSGDAGDAACSWNQSYQPKFADDTSGRGCHYPDDAGPSYWYSPTQTPDRPIVCVNWCDARDYCRWAGKHLCGSMERSVAIGIDDYAAADKSEWFNACSQGGITSYPYGNAYRPSSCHGSPNDASAGCEGFTGPDGAVRAMSGGVSEWQDVCGPLPPDMQVHCLIGGGNAKSGGASDVRCDSLAYASPNSVSAGRGFRCCK